jgi:hypothetical protein
MALILNGVRLSEDGPEGKGISAMEPPRRRSTFPLFALQTHLDYDFSPARMTTTDILLCDGCGQPASSEHLARRLQRLEWTTRYRPVHIGTVLLGAFAPEDTATFLYANSNTGDFIGEAGNVLASSGISQNGKSSEATLAEFQRAGFLLTYVLECPLNPGVHDEAAIQGLLRSRFPALLARVRRSLRPKRIVPISSALESLMESVGAGELGCSVVLDGGKPFALDRPAPDLAIAHLNQVLTAPNL